MSKRGWGITAIVMGGVLAAVSLAADVLAVGAVPGILGWKQLLGVGIGLLILISGVGLLVRGRSSRSGRRSRKSSGAEAGGLHSSTSATARVTALESWTYDSAALRVPFVHEISELGRYRFLLWNLVLRDLKVRYKRSVLGFFWAMVNPLLTMLVLLVVFTGLFRFEVEHYSIYILSGLLLWNLFARGTTMAMRSVIDNSGVRNKIYVPASVFVAAAVGSALVNLLFALIPLLALAVITGLRPNLAWFYLPIPILQTTLLTFGIGVLIAALAVFFADMLDIYEVLLGAFFYLTPIIYPVTILPDPLQKLQWFNLLFAFIAGFRSPLLYGRVPDPGVVLLTTLGALAVTIVGWTLFTRLLDQFAYRA